MPIADCPAPSALGVLLRIDANRDTAQWSTDHLKIER